MLIVPIPNLKISVIPDPELNSAGLHCIAIITFNVPEFPAIENSPRGWHDASSLHRQHIKAVANLLMKALHIPLLRAFGENAGPGQVLEWNENISDVGSINWALRMPMQPLEDSGDLMLLLRIDPDILIHPLVSSLFNELQSATKEWPFEVMMAPSKQQLKFTLLQ